MTGRADEWHLHGTVDEHLACLVERDAGRASAARGATRATAESRSGRT